MLRCTRLLAIAVLLTLTLGVASAAAQPATPSATASDPGKGTREDPIKRGHKVRAGDYEIEVKGVKRNANEIVAAENQFNDPPAEGRRFYLVTVEITYVGKETGTPWAELRFSAVGKTNVSYQTFEDRCGVIPSALSDAGEMFPGGAVKANVCWSVKDEDAGNLVMYVDPSYNKKDRVFFELVKKD